MDDTTKRLLNDFGYLLFGLLIGFGLGYAVRSLH